MFGHGDMKLKDMETYNLEQHTWIPLEGINLIVEDQSIAIAFDDVVEGLVLLFLSFVWYNRSL